MNLNQKLTQIKKIINGIKKEMEQAVCNSCNDLTYNHNYFYNKVNTIKGTNVNTFLNNMPGVKKQKNGDKIICDQIVDLTVNKYNMYPREFDSLICKEYVNDLIADASYLLENKCDDFLLTYSNACKVNLFNKLDIELSNSESVTKRVKL